MKKASSLLLIFTLIILSCTTPTEKQWFRGNLHTHSYWSDGDEFPETIMDWYKSHGYDFVALSDHNTLAEGEKWKTIRPDSVYQASFQKYLATYGDEWVVWEENEDGSYFEMRIIVDEITKDVSLFITDFAEEDEVDEAKMLWENQVSDLKQVLGST